jgi:putative FmdB family regulatory protein
MPIYDYKCSNCGNIFEERQHIAEREIPEKLPCPDCRAQNTVKQIICAPAICDPILIGIRKPPADFQKYVLGRIRDSVPGNVLRHKNITRDI